MTKREINRAITHTGLTIQGNRGAGYFYFIDEIGDQIGDSIMVYALKHQPLHRWVEDAELAKSQGRS